jgi:hypothetical protein
MPVFSILCEGTNAPAHGNAKMPVWSAIFLKMDGNYSDVPHLRLKVLTDYIENLQIK